MAKTIEDLMREQDSRMKTVNQNEKSELVLNPVHI